MASRNKVKIINPFVNREGYNCFGCCPTNEQGLRLDFNLEGDKVTALWTPLPAFQGWNNILHGGIQATLMDEIGSWFAIVMAKTTGVTTSLNVKYRLPVPTDQGAIRLEAALQERHGHLLSVHTRLFLPNGKLGSEAIATYYMFDEKKAREKFHYPGAAAFIPGDV